MNLIVSGCSFTLWTYKTWPDYVIDLIPEFKLHQLAHPGAGNYYIRRSTIDYILENNLDSSNTCVVIMWSGISRRDVEVSSKFIELGMVDKKDCKITESSCFISSGGQLGEWNTVGPSKHYFRSLYKMTDQKNHLKETIDNIKMLELFLESKNIKYFFTSYTNNFISKEEWAGDDYTAYFCDASFHPEKIINANWIFADDTQNSLHEVTKNAKMFSDDKFHPNTEAHKLFAEQIVLELKKTL